MQERKFRKGCGRYEPKGKSACPTDKTAVEKSLIALMKEKAFYQITVSDVCTLSELNRSTFYRHYNNVHDILLELENDLIESTKACIAEIDETAIQAASQPLNKLLSYIKESREIYLLFLHQSVDKEFRFSLMKLAMHLIMDKFAFSETETDNEERTIYLMNGSIALIDEWLEKGAVIPVEEVTELLLKYSNAVFRC